MMNKIRNASHKNHFLTMQKLYTVVYNLFACKNYCILLTGHRLDDSFNENFMKDFIRYNTP